MFSTKPNSQKLSGKAASVMAAFNQAIDGLSQVSKEAREAATEVESQIAELQKEKQSLEELGLKTDSKLLKMKSVFED